MTRRMRTGHVGYVRYLALALATAGLTVFLGPSVAFGSSSLTSGIGTVAVSVPGVSDLALAWPPVGASAEAAMPDGHPPGNALADE